MAGQGARELDEDTTNVNTICDELARLPPLNESTTQQTLEIREKVCPHLVADLTYSEVEDLSKQLDPYTRKGIIDLMRDLKAKEWLSEVEYITVWRSCHGGQEPALGFLHHLDTSEGTTLKELKELVKKAQCYQEVLSYIDDCIEAEHGDTRLGLLSQPRLDKIASYLSYDEYPKPKSLQPKWKRVASEAKLRSNIIEVLDIPAQHDREWGSPTKQLFRFITTTYPNFKVATLAKALFDIGRVDLLQLQSAKLQLFEKCWHLEGERCLREVGRRPVAQEAQDGFDGDLC